MAESGEEIVAEIRGLTVVYAPPGKPQICALNDANLVIHRREAIGILGESGCGKSTLAAAVLHILPEYARHEEGNIFFRGRDLRTFSEAELQGIRGCGIALIGQDPALSLNPVMRAGDQIAEVLRAHRREGRNRTRAAELCMEGVGLPRETYYAYPHQLSGGQRQRVAIAQAIACRPALVIADEATSKLDPETQAGIISLLKEIRNRHDTAFLVISHDPSVLAQFVERIAVMYAGSIVEEGSAAEMFQRTLHPYTRELVALAKQSVVSTANRSTRFVTIPGEPANTTRFQTGCRFEPRCPERMEVCTNCVPVESVTQPNRRVRCFKYGD
jgi:oligopeptide/dipeptide ABC transporter ATP-binding protein